MTSQKSTGKNTICLLSLIREDLRHKTWMLALSILGSFLAGPVAALFFIGRMIERTKSFQIRGNSVYNFQGDFIMTLAEYYQSRLNGALEYLSKFHLAMMLFIAFVGALIVALGGFRYLYHKRMVDLYHASPVSRKRLFIATWLSGFLIWFVPMLISSLLVFPILVYYAKGTFFATILVHLLLCILRLSLCYLIVYNACLVAVMLSGNFLNAIVGSLSYGLIIAMGIFAFQILEQTFYDNVLVPNNLIYSHPLYAFSPLLTPLILALTWLRQNDGMAYYCWHLCAGTLIMAFNFFLAFRLYLKRPSELSERGIENKPVRIVLRFLVSFVGGIGFTMISYKIADHQIGWMLFGAFFGSAVAFCVMNVICHGSFKDAFSHKLQYLGVFAACVLLFVCMILDLTGYAKRLPKKENLTGICLYADSLQDFDWDYVAKDGRLMRLNNGLETSGKIICRDQELIHALLTACVQDKGNDVGNVIGLNVKVHTKWGAYYRRYHLPLSEIDLLKPIVESKEYQDYYYPLRSMQFGLPKRIVLTSSFSKEEYVEDPDRIEQLMNAFHQDFEEHNGIRDLFRDSRTFSLRFYYPTESSYASFNHNVPYWYEHTIDLIESWYPKKVWDPSLDDATTFTLTGSVTMRDDENLLDVLNRNFGYDAQGNPFSEPPANPDAYSYDCDRYAYWTVEWKDLDLLKEIEPYLIWGTYSDELTMEYAFLGWAEFENSGSVDCYVRYGKLPQSLLEEIRKNLIIQNVSWDYATEDNYYEEYYYQEENHEITDPYYFD